MIEKNSNLTDMALDILKNDNLLITGGAGTGKSYLTRDIISSYKEVGLDVVALGSTGISAVNIGGLTIHSFFAFGISSNLEELREHDRRNKKRLSELKKIISATDLIIIDEISMVSANLLDMVRYRLTSLGFSGKIMMVGDFYQLPPVIKSSTLSNSLFGDRVFAFESDAWRFFEPVVLELRESKRTKDDYFANILSKIRRGELDNETVDYLSDIQNRAIPAKSHHYTRLYSRNIDVNRINRENIDRLDGDLKSISSIFKSEKSIYPSRIQKWKEALPVNDILDLKVGTPLLFTVNKWGRYYNGERGVLREIEDDFLLIEKDDKYLRVERHDFDMVEINTDGLEINTQVVATLSQFAVKPAYAVTIHKSQGMGIENLICNIDAIFAPSQFYVAISRAITPENLFIEFGGIDFRAYLERVVRVDRRVTEWENSIKKRVSE